MRKRHTRGDVSRLPKWRASSQAGGSCEESRESSTRKGSQVGAARSRVLMRLASLAI